ncbi:MAG: cupin domain-containing protein [Thermomicrobiales bacterium]
MNHLIPIELMGRFDVGPAGSFARIVNGVEHGLASVSLMMSEVQPGEGPARHRHAYDEVFVVEAGDARFLIGDEVVDATPGQVVLVPAGIAHSFANTGDDLLRLTAVHVAPRVAIEWLDEPAS